ncbi:MAG TPA: C4-type zinc ribbon domain-containing protein [Polyangiaceae bacterium]|nr:C4-type zinc ribbon domain-containing protein [Polyangiaceae bacterium]
MSIQSQIDALEKLSELDAELKDLGEVLRKERGELDTKKTRLSELIERLSRGKTSIEEMERARGDLMGEARQLLIQVERSREKLSRCRTEREANAVQRELEELRKLHRDREVEMEKLDVLINQGRADVTAVLVEHDKIEADLAAIEGEATGRIAEAQASFDERSQRRLELVKAVPPQLYRRYELVRSRRGTAVAYTHTGVCSACNIHLPPMLFQQLKRGEELGQCPSCNRILYFRAVVPAGASESSDA